MSRQGSVRIAVDVELRNLQNVINTMKTALSGVSRDSKAFAPLERELSSIEKRFRELSHTASRSFTTIGGMNAFERQMLKLGDRVSDFSKSLSDISFGSLDLSKIEGAQKEFSRLKGNVEEAQKKLDGVGNAQWMAAMKDDASEVSRAFRELKALNLEDLFKDKNLSGALTNMSHEASNAEKRIVNLQTAIDNLNARNEAATRTKTSVAGIQQIVGQGLDGLNFQDFAAKINQGGHTAGMDPTTFLNAIGITPEVFAKGAEEINRKLAIALKQSSKDLVRIDAETSSYSGQLDALEKQVNAIVNARQAVQTLLDSTATADQKALALDELVKAEGELDNFKNACIQAYKAMNNLGNTGGNINNSMNRISASVRGAQSELERLNRTANTLSQLNSRLAYFFGFYKVMNTLTSQVKKAINTIKELDKVMTEIAVVTQMTQKDLWAQMDTYSKIASEYAVSIKGAYEVSQLWYQQGGVKYLTFSRNCVII